jgi:hypothetical protein
LYFLIILRLSLALLLLIASLSRALKTLVTGATYPDSEEDTVVL